MYGKVLFLSLTLVPKIHFFRLLPKKQRISVYIHIYIYLYICINVQAFFWIRCEKKRQLRQP